MKESIVTILFFMACSLFIYQVVEIGKEYDQKLKAHQEANAILEEKLDSYRMSEAECKAVLVHTVAEGVRLTELIVKNKGKK